MRRLRAAIFVGLSSIALAGCTQHTLPTTDFRTTSQQLYVNKLLGFSVALPGDWSLPRADDRDPHFFEIGHCSQWNCVGLEIESDDADYAEGPSGAFSIAAATGLKPQRIDNFIPGAAVIASEPEGGAEGYRREYHVFFPKEKRAFVVLSTTADEEGILQTMTAPATTRNAGDMSPSITGTSASLRVFRPNAPPQLFLHFMERSASSAT